MSGGAGWLPDTVERYLQTSMQLERLRQEVRRTGEDLKLCEAAVKEELENVPGQRYSLNFDAGQEARYGRPGALRIDSVRRKEYMSFPLLEKYLLRYYEKHFSPGQSMESIRNFAHETAVAVWNDRETVETIVVKRSVARHQKKKKSKRSDVEYDDAFEEHM